MAAVRHLGFVTSSYRTTHEVFLLGHSGLSNFMLIRCTVLKIWRFEIFADLAWNAYSRPQKFWFLGVWTPKRDWSSSRPTKGTSLAETALTCQFWCRLVHWCDLCVSRMYQKKEKEARKETYSGKLGVRQDHPRWRSDMWSCMPGGLRAIVLSFKFRQNRLNGFRDVGVEICHFLYLRPVAYITAWKNNI